MDFLDNSEIDINEKITDSFITEYSSNNLLIEYIQSKFYRMNRDSSIKLIILILKQYTNHLIPKQPNLLHPHPLLLHL